MPQVQAAALLKRVERLAEELAEAPRKRVSWQQDGRHYDAELVLEPARNGDEPERAIAEVSSEQRGKQLRTRISLTQLSYSHFAQVIDRWDPAVQLHDDQIVGRMHINSRFNVLYDSQAAPKLAGKVTTAGAASTWSGGAAERTLMSFRRALKPMRGGFRSQSRVCPSNGRSTSRTSASTNLRVIRVSDFSPTAVTGGTTRPRVRRIRQPVCRPIGVFFIASRGATVYLRGVVSGKFLVYSPTRIVVEGDTRYARDPHNDPESDDFLGLVCDGDIEVAPPGVTGPGDLNIQAALFANRRIVVTKAMHSPSATLHIFGSLAAGSLSESEPALRHQARIRLALRAAAAAGFPVHEPICGGGLGR